MNSSEIVVVDPLANFAEIISAVPELSDVAFNLQKKSASSSQELIEICKNYEIIVTDVVSVFDEKVLSNLPKLKTLITASIGTNHIDLEFCRANKIEVVNFPGFCAPAVAEVAFGYMLSLIRNFKPAQDNLLSGKFDTQSFYGSELRNKTLGIIGAGDIAKSCIPIAKGFGMKILCHTAHPSDDRAKALGIEEFSTKDEVLGESDFVLLAIPATPETENYISKNELSQMKASSYLINVSRYQIVDAEAVAEAINEKTIAGYATDVPGPEPYSLNDQPEQIQKALRSPNVLVVPHIAGSTKEADEDLYSRMVNELIRLTSAN